MSPYPLAVHCDRSEIHFEISTATICSRVRNGSGRGCCRTENKRRSSLLNGGLP